MIKTCTPCKTRGGETRAGLIGREVGSGVGKVNQAEKPARGNARYLLPRSTLRGQWPLHFVQYCTSFRGAKTCDIGKKGVFLVI